MEFPTHRNTGNLIKEEIVIASLKKLLNDPSLISKWIEIYQSKTTSDLPELYVQTKKMDQEILTTSKRISNLVQRIADLPAEVPADAFYEQIKQMTQKGLYAPVKEPLKATGTEGTPTTATVAADFGHKKADSSVSFLDWCASPRSRRTAPVYSAHSRI